MLGMGRVSDRTAGSEKSLAVIHPIDLAEFVGRNDVVTGKARLPQNESSICVACSFLERRLCGCAGGSAHLRLHPGRLIDPGELPRCSG